MFRFDEKEFVAELDRKREQQFLKRVRDYDEQIAPTMKHRGMYWSIEGACTMSRMILIERIDQLYELFFGNWRNEYEEYRASRLGAGFLVDHRPHGAVIRKRGRKRK